MEGDFDREFMALFSTVAPASTERGPWWEPELSPLFPTRWPATRGTLVLRYAYARGSSMDLIDGEHTAAPWAIVCREGIKRDLSLVGPFLDLGIQGVRPLEEDEVDQPRPDELADEFRSLVIAGLPPRPPSRIRAAYQAWQAQNGVIAEVLARLQAGFFAWLRA
jgi:hypothetical protein